MAVGLDESRCKHMVWKVSSTRWSPQREFIERTNAEDAVAADGDGFGTR